MTVTFTCRLCDAPYKDDALDFIKCEECPVMVCENCDKRNFMRNCADAVTRCAVCQKLWDLRQEVRESQRSPPCGYQDQQIQHLESYTPNAPPDVPDRPVLVIQEMIRTQQIGEKPQSPSTEVSDILYSA